MSDLIEKIKKRIEARKWKITDDAFVPELIGMQYANNMNDWCLKIIDEELAKEPQECEFAHYKDLAEQGRLVDIETYQQRLIRYIDAGKYRSADKKVFSENDVVYLIEHGVFQCEAEQGKYLQKGRDDR